MPLSQPAHLSRSTQVYLGLAGYLILVRLVITVWPVRFPHPSQEESLSWAFLAILILAGVISTELSEQSGFAPMLGGGVAPARRFGLPALLGLGFGAVTILLDLWFGLAAALAARLGVQAIHIELPGSLLVYPLGAIIVETMFRLVPLSLLVWFVGVVLLRRRGLETVFWVAAAVFAAWEPLGQLGLLREARPALAYGAGVLFYAENLIQCWLFRRAGFLAPLTLRLAHYLVWHIVWGGLLDPM